MAKINLSSKQWVLLATGILFILYVLFQARYLILGPQVWINSPADGDIVHSEALEVLGLARNTAWLWLNGRQIYTDANGEWRETLLLSPGTSIMTVRAIDRFGREIERSIRIIRN